MLERVSPCGSLLSRGYGRMMWRTWYYPQVKFPVDLLNLFELLDRVIARLEIHSRLNFWFWR